MARLTDEWSRVTVKLSTVKPTLAAGPQTQMMVLQHPRVGVQSLSVPPAPSDAMALR